MSSYFNLKIKEVIRETPNAISIHFKQPLFKKVKYKAGQFLTLIVPINGTTYRRSYSISTAPHLDNTVAVTIKRVAGGIVSNYLNDNAKAGQKIEVMEAMGNFKLITDPKNTRHVVLFGGGSGITPLMSMLKSTLAYEANSCVSLFYANHDEENIIFKAQLDKLQEKHANRLTINHFLNSENNKLDSGKVKSLIESISDFASENTSYYLCGPTGMMECIEVAMEQLSLSDKVFKESFVSTANENGAANQADISTQHVKISLNGETHKVSVLPSKTILDAGLDEGLDMPFSCQSGLCTACRAKLLTGQVVMDTDEALTEAEIQDNYILCCQAHPLTKDVSIEVG